MISIRAPAAPPDEPRRDHLGVVDDEEVARPHQLRQIGDMPVTEAARRRQHQEARRLARLGRPVGDQLARQGEVEIGEVHRGQAMGIGSQAIADRGTDFPRSVIWAAARFLPRANRSQIARLRGDLAPARVIVNKTIILTALEVNAGLFALPFRQPWVLNKYYKVSRARCALVR